jgi:hypothetical protein
MLRWAWRFLGTIRLVVWRTWRVLRMFGMRIMPLLAIVIFAMLV